MWLPLLFLVQSASGASADDPNAIDLTIRDCRTSPDRPEEIVVCARRDNENRYRIGPQTEVSADLPKAAIKLGDSAALTAEAEQGELGGRPTNRALLKLKIKF